MPSSTSSSSEEYWVRPMAERRPPATDWTLISILALLIIVAGVGGWEWRTREAGFTTADMDDGEAAWARERRKVDRIEGSDAIVGSSRLLFDTDLGLWREMAGRAPLQLAMPGTNARAIIADLAKDPKFKGLMVVGVDPLIFFGRDGRGPELIKYYHDEPLFKRSGLWLYERLGTVFAYLDHVARPMSWVYRIDVPQRTKRGPFNSPWKLSTASNDRQTFLWDRIESDPELRAKASAVWLVPPRRPPPTLAEVGKGIDEVARNVALIRSRGGEVVFVRSPSDGGLLEAEEKLYPRAKTWDRLIARSGSIGVHYADDPIMRNLHTIELSHLDRRDAAIFTRALVEKLNAELARRGKFYGGLGERKKVEPAPNPKA